MTNKTQKKTGEGKQAEKQGGKRQTKAPAKQTTEKYTWKHQLKRLPWLLLIPFGLLIPTMVRSFPDKVESIYSRTVFPVIARVMGFLSSVFPFSLAEILIIAAAAFIVIMLLIRLLSLILGKLKERRRHRIRLVSFIISVLIFAGVMLNLFYLFWGLNHFRLSAPKLMELDVHSRPVEELADVCTRLADEAAAFRENCEEDENGVFTIDREAVFGSVKKAYEQLGEADPLFDNSVYTAKTVIFSNTLSKLDIAGIYIPYTAEANVNVAQPALFVPSGAAHETAHYFGFAREDEADFISYYASLFSDDPAFRYSASMNALNYCAMKLYEADSELYFEVLRGHYSDAMIRDLLNYREYYEIYADKPAAQVGQQVNDTYLKHNDQPDGVKSYGNMVDLLLAYFEKSGN